MMPYTNPEDKKRNRAEYKASGRQYEVQRLWNENNRDRVNKHRRDYWVKLKTDPERYANHKQHCIKYRIERRRKAINKYGGACACCGETTFEFLGFDHINGGGVQERRKLGVDPVFTLINRGRKDIRILCHNCNLARGFYGRCPHEDKI